MQIEEALKLYQAALKLHAQGPASYLLAREAYSNLFTSAIFNSPEVITEFQRIDEHPELELIDTSFPLELDLVASVGEGSPNTLQQIFYLSYKNYGQFILDCLKSGIRKRKAAPFELGEKQFLALEGRAAINNFALALTRDESDTELWRRASRIGTMFGSKRVARYCLEAAVEVDDDPTVAEVDPTLLEEGFAGEQLKNLLEDLSDEMSLSHPIMAPYKKKGMPEFLRKHMDPYSFLPDALGLGSKTPDSEKSEVIQKRRVVEVIDQSWAALGEALCALTLPPEGVSAAGIVVRFPRSDVESTLAPVPAHLAAEDQIMKDVASTESPTAESSEAALATLITTNIEDRPLEIITNTTTVPISDGRSQSQNVNLPTRKRSQSAAGIRDTPEDDNGAQKRSKRIRNRDNTSEIDPATQCDEQLQQFIQADDRVFEFVGGLLKNVEVPDLGAFSELKSALANDGGSDRAEKVVNTAVRDLRDILRDWDDNKASAFMNAVAADVLGSTGGTVNAGLAAFLENSKVGPLNLSTKPAFGMSDGIIAFVQKVEAEWMSLQDVVFEWLCFVLATYRESLWPEDLKISVVRVISFVDAEIYGRIQLEIEKARTKNGKESDLAKFEEMVESLFELHIDIYSRITNPASQVHYETRIMTKERLNRWASLAADVVQTRPSEPMDVLSTRYLWASVFYATMFDDVSREHKVLLWSDLQSLLEEANESSIELLNNAVMPEIAVAAAEREVSRLTTMDFFYNLFNTDTSDPWAIIETLEPVLNPEQGYDSAVRC